jgi:hypothetical protein
MRVIIEADLFRPQNLDKNHANLLALFQIGKEGVHTVEVEPRNDPKFVAWRNGESLRTQRLCNFALERGSKLQVRRRHQPLRVAEIAAPLWPDLKLPLDIAVRLLQRPLVLLLENARNDRSFLQTITQLHPDFNLEARIANRHVDVQTGGGIGESKKWIEDPRRTPEELARVWVLSDSDARQSWRKGTTQLPQHLSSDVRDLEVACNQRNVPLHILTRRFIENYLPLPILLAWSAEDHLVPEKRTRVPKYNAFTKLRPEQRHHYNMKKGFVQDREDKMHTQRVGDFYDDVPVEVMQALEDGFGKDIASRFEDGIHANWLRNDNQEDEALRIVESILEHL